MTQVVVWVTAGADWSGWTQIDRLIPEQSDHTDGSRGRATFRMLRRLRNDGAGDIADTFYPTRGQYIAIARAGGVSPFDGLLWCGVVTGVNPQPIQYVDDEMGEVVAVELGSVLDQTPVANLQQRNPAGGATLTLLTNPTANIAGAHGEIVGNMASGDVFESLPDVIGAGSASRWNPYALLTRALTDSTLGTVVPPLSISMLSSLSTYLSGADMGVVELDGLSISDLIDTLVGSSCGMSWKVIPNASGWTINVASASDVSVGDFPAATPVTATLDGNDTDLSFDSSGADVYDAVEVIGAPIVCAGTVSPLDGSAGKGWSDAAEAAFLAGASGTGGYGAMTTTEKLAANRGVRRSAALQDVFSRIELRRYTPHTDLQCKAAAGAPAGSVQFLTPLLSWNGTTTTVTANSSTLYLPSARILRQIPWPSGKSADGSDTRTDTAKGQPTYLQPIVLRYTTGGDAWVGWSDMLHPPSKKWPIPTISVDDRGPAIRIEYDHPEVLALDRWSGAAVSEFDPELTTSYGATDYERLVITVAVESGQRVRARVLRPGITEAQVRNVLRIERPDLHCWLVRAHTIIGLKEDVTPDELAADTFTRDDHAIAQRLAEQAAAFAFRPRTGATIAVTDPANPPAWAEIGALIDNIDEVDPDGVTLTQTSNTVVRGIRQVWDPRRPRLIVSTDFSAMPSMGSDRASVSLGGTTRASIQRTRSAVVDLQRDVARMPITPGSRGTPTTAINDQRSVEQTAHGFTVDQAIRWNGTAWVLADASNGREKLGVVITVTDADHFEVASWGLVELSGLTANATYYLDVGAGSLTASLSLPNPTARAVYFAISTTQALLLGPLQDDWKLGAINHCRDVELTGATPNVGDILYWDGLGHGCWNNGPPPAALTNDSVTNAFLRNSVGLSVIGRSANSTGDPADIVASTTGDVLYMGASSLMWGPLGTASYQPASVTAAKLGTDVVLDTLNDVTIASVAGLNFLRYDSTATQWKNYDLGPIAYTPGSPNQLSLDGGGAGTAGVVGIGHANSHLIVAGGGRFDFLLSGSVTAGTDVSGRIRAVSSAQVSFYDQALSGTTDGTEVLRWGCSSSAASRYFRFLIPLQIADTGGTDSLNISGAGTREWLISDTAGSPKDYLKLYNNHGTVGTLVQFQQHADLTGNKLYMNRGGTSSGASISGSASTMLLYAGTSGKVTVGDSLNVIAFFNGTGSAQVTVADPAAINVSGTAGASYTTTERNMINALATDVTNLRATLLNLCNALQGYNLV